jgi:hypothetical protein
VCRWASRPAAPSGPARFRGGCCLPAGWLYAPGPPRRRSGVAETSTGRYRAAPTHRNPPKR